MADLLLWLPERIDFLCAEGQLFVRLLNGEENLCDRTAWSEPKLTLQPPTIVDQLIVLSGARAADRITVAGCKTLDVLLGLCRRGFLHCSCRTMSGGPRDGANSADSLWILETHDAAELRTLIAKCGRDLRSGGTLVVGFDAHGPADSAARLGEVLMKCGFIPVKEAHSPDRGFLVCCHKRQHAQALAA